MIDTRSESNISTNETKKAAVRSHREPNGGLPSYSFLSLGVRTTPDHKSGRAHLQNVASRWAKLKFWKIEFLQLFHSKSGVLYAKTPHFRAAFSALHLSSTHFGTPDRIRTCGLVSRSHTRYPAAPRAQNVWWAVLDSNQRPLACRASALTSWANRPWPLHNIIIYRDVKSKGIFFLQLNYKGIKKTPFFTKKR